MSETTVPAGDRRSRSKSKSYPAYSLQDCVGFIASIRDYLGIGPYNREAIAQALESSNGSGAFNRKVSALVQFSLLQKDGEAYRLSPIAERITVPLSETERLAGIKDAFESAPLYSDLLDAFSTEGRVPRLLENTLIRRFGIQASAAKSAASVFRASGEFAGVLGEDGQIRRSEAQEETYELAGADNPTVTGADDGGGDSHPTCTADVQPAGHGSKPGGSDQPFQSFKLALGQHRFAVLTTPCDLTPVDVRLIHKQIEVLALQAELSDIGLLDEV